MAMHGYRQALGGKFPLDTSNQLVFKRYSGFVKLLTMNFLYTGKIVNFPYFKRQRTELTQEIV